MRPLERGTRLPGRRGLTRAALAALLFAGCGGTVSLGVEGEDGGAGARDAGLDAPRQDVVVASDAGSDGPILHFDSSSDGPIVDGPPPAVSCPPKPPATSASCPKVGLACEYGTSTGSVGCDDIYTCKASGWTVMTATAASCPSATCPPSTVSAGGTCTSAQKGLICPQGANTCTCYTVPDAGTRWECVPRGTGCPTTRPAIGSACTDPSLTCNYGTCAGGVELQCSGGLWKEIFPPCPPP